VIILDTNVVASLMRRDGLIVDWLDRQPSPSVWTSSISVYETRFGIEILATGRRREGLEHRFNQLIELLDERVMPFDRAAAEAAGRIAASQRRVGQPIEVRDVQIAGITAANKATLATRNTRHFQGIGLKLIDPWSSD
jgi:predicted nucleic acid-binding protein